MSAICLLILQDGIPVRLGTTGTLILSAVSVVLGGLYLWQLYKRKNLESLQSALNASEAERKIHEDASKRKSAELAEAHQTIGELKAKTDLSEVLKMLSETISLNRESVDLSRKFDRENSQLNASLARTIEKHGESDKQIFGEISDSLKNVAETLIELKTEIRDHRKDARTMIDGVNGKLTTLEQKVNRKPHERSGS